MIQLTIFNPLSFLIKPKGKSLNPTPQTEAKMILKKKFEANNKERKFLELEPLKYSEWKSEEYKIAFIQNYVKNYCPKKAFLSKGKYLNNKTRS